MTNNIIIAEHSGFCFGVKRAADSIEKRLSKSQQGERIYTLGKLIHNDTYILNLARRGVVAVSERELETLVHSATAISPVVLFIRAHGISRQVENFLISASESNQYFEYIDCTCPYVKKNTSHS